MGNKEWGENVRARSLQNKIFKKSHVEKIIEQQLGVGKGIMKANTCLKNFPGAWEQLQQRLL